MQGRVPGEDVGPLLGSRKDAPLEILRRRAFTFLPALSTCMLFLFAISCHSR